VRASASGRYSLGVNPASFCVSLVASILVASPTLAAPQTPSSIAAVASDDRWSDAALDAYVDATRAATLARCNAEDISLPADFLAWIDADPTRRLSVYGCRADPLPVLLALRSLEIDLGIDTVRRDYPQLALAFAIQDSYAPRAARALVERRRRREAREAPARRAAARR
jgi:hypothetical protein